MQINAKGAIGIFICFFFLFVLHVLFNYMSYYNNNENDLTNTNTVSLITNNKYKNIYNTAELKGGAAEDSVKVIDAKYFPVMITEAKNSKRQRKMTDLTKSPTVSFCILLLLFVSTI